MSLVLLASLGRRASTSPAWISTPRLDVEDRADRQVVADLRAARQLDRLRRPASCSTIEGRRLAPRVCWRQSTTSLLARPVASSTTSRKVTPSTMSMNTALARGFGDDRQGVRIPLGEPRALGHLGVRRDQQAGAVGQPMARLLAAALVVQDQLGGPPERHQAPLAVGHQVGIEQLHRAVDRGLDVRALGLRLRGAADVEGAHGQLGARLADALRRDHADRLADVDRRAARQIAAVAQAAHPAQAVAGQHRADRHALDHRLVQNRGPSPRRAARCARPAPRRWSDARRPPRWSGRECAPPAPRSPRRPGSPRRA